MTIEGKVERLLKVAVRLIGQSDAVILEAQTVCPHHKTTLFAKHLPNRAASRATRRCDLCGKFLREPT